MLCQYVELWMIVPWFEVVHLVVKPDFAPSSYVQKLTRTMKTSGARRKNPSQIAPGSAHRAVTQPRSRASPASSARTRARSCAISSSASSTSARTRSAGSGAEELCILLLPDDPDLVALAPAEVRVALARDLREHALAAGGEMELDEVAEELDEEDLA